MIELLRHGDHLRITGGLPEHAGQFLREYPAAIYRKGGTKTAPYWKVPLLDADTLMPWADQHGVAVADDVREYAAALWSRKLTSASRSGASALPAEFDCEVDGLIATLLPAQEVVVTIARDQLRTRQSEPAALLVADEPGLGKTVMALASLRLHGLNAQRAIIVCPTNLTANWQAEMVQHFDHGSFHPWVAQGKTATEIPPEADTVVIGWEVLFDWSEMLSAWGPDAIVADEGHYAKSGRQRKQTRKKPKLEEDGSLARDESGNAIIESETVVVGGSARATAALDLGKSVAKNHGIVIALTGTPVVNRPLELLPLLDFANLIGTFGSDSSFKNRYCGPKPIPGRQGMSYTGASNLMELNTRLVVSGHYVRRTKESLIRSGVLKPKYVDSVYAYDYSTKPSPWIITATPAEMDEYRAVESEQREFFTERAQEFAEQLHAEVDSATVRKKVGADAARHLKRLGELRKAAAVAKVRHVQAKVEQLVASGEKVVIAAHHREIVDAYADAFSGLKIQGEMSVKAIEHAKRLFNETGADEHPVLVLSVDAGKTGHTLCKQGLSGAGKSCALMVFAEQVWTPGDELQAQDRIWRIGQDREVWITNALLAWSVDMKIYAQRQNKRRVVNAAVDAIDPEQVAKDMAAQGAREIVQQLVYAA